ncbi:MAG: hypothetical protein GEV09_04645 [Pseudonocardiaceae bacterium]|nr:hypothetical protein [Pseudonocardiaceae bacterium]
MNVLTALILFSGLAALLCAKARAAGPALFFGVVAVALLTATPLGAELGRLIDEVSDYAARTAAEANGGRR